MALNDVNKDELVDFAEARGIDASGNKPEVVERLEAEGVTEDDVRAWQEGTSQDDEEPSSDTRPAEQPQGGVPENQPETVVQHPSGDEDEESPNARLERNLGLVDDEEEEEARESEDKILIKLDAPFSSIRTHGTLFTQDHPFAPVSREVADELLQSRSFRQAHPSEADAFYG